MTGVDDAHASEVRYVRRESRIRGMLLGLALGDAWRSERHPRRGSTTTQLACFTTEGLIRAIVRQGHKGICHEPSVIWHAYLRWASHQRIPGVYSLDHSDGWLVSVGALGRRRGDAPAVVAALRAHHGGFSAQPTSGTSAGHHALTRLVALAVGIDDNGRGRAVDVAQECAAATHGGPDVPAVVAAGMRALGVGLHSAAVTDWRSRIVLLDEGLSRVIDEAGPPASPPLTARAALESAVTTVLRFPEPESITAALDDVAARPEASGAGPLTGALLGALHGAEALPSAVWDLELGHVVDTLARDLTVQVERPRDGNEHQPATDPHWWSRYPGS